MKIESNEGHTRVIWCSCFSGSKGVPRNGIFHRILPSAIDSVSVVGGNGSDAVVAMVVVGGD
jgi:hypothetical protein